MRQDTVEDYRRGYPRLAAFMSIDGKFAVMKRFNVLHMRNLLYLQDILSETEERLNACDDTENVDMYLSSRRKDGNATRQLLLKGLDEKLKAYGCSARMGPSFMRR
jgi:hypothetical protein